MVNIYVIYEKRLSWFDFGKDFALKKYSVYDTGFDARGCFLLSDGSRFAKIVILFGADINSSIHINSKKNDILVLGKSPTDGLDDATLIAEKAYSINFTERQKKLTLRKFHYNEVSSYIFFNGVETYKFKGKGSEIIAALLFLGKVSEDFQFVI